ncbi:MAG: chemotaxis protein [Lachnospiraceae bacterium]|nr:chemotaxis protein [Lachnospiraceae bacterium]
MFRKKNEVNLHEADMNLLIGYMDRAMAGDFTPLNASEFHNPALVEKYNSLLTYVLESNNKFVMRLNKSMIKIGDSTVVKNMIEQVNSQTTAINDMRGSSQDLGDSIMNIQFAAQNIQDNCHVVIDTSTRCTDDMNVSINIVDESTKQISDINNQIDEFKEKAEKINQIIDTVKELAQDSSLLALNASIEAARAGEAGRGFAVVAQQVGQLSANTTSCADDVVKYVGELMEGITALSESVEQTTKQLQNGNESVHKSVDDLHIMHEQLDSISKAIDSIYEEINTQSALTQSFVASIETIAESYDTLSQECIATGDHMYRISREIDNTRSDMARSNSKLTTQDWLTVFEIDHLIFTWRVYNNLADFEKLVITQLNNPKGCKFGKWVANQTDPRIVNSRELFDLVKWHEEIHKYCTDSWSAKDAGDREEALRLFNLALDAYEKFKPAMNAVRELFRSIGETAVTDYERKVK